MRLEDANNRRERVLHTAKHVFFDTDDDDVNHGVEESPPETSGVGGGGAADDAGSVAAGARAETWFQRIEDEVRENMRRSRRNYNRLERLDFRTVWIARLIVGVLVTVIGGIILQIILVA